MYLDYGPVGHLLTKLKAYLPVNYALASNGIDYVQSIRVFDDEGGEMEIGQVISATPTDEAMVKELMVEHRIVLARKYHERGVFEMVLVAGSNLTKFDKVYGYASILMQPPESGLTFIKRGHQGGLSTEDFFQSGMSEKFLPQDVTVRRIADNAVELLDFNIDYDGRRYKLPWRVAPIVLNGFLMWRVMEERADTRTAPEKRGITCATSKDAWDVLMALHNDHVEQRTMRKAIEKELFPDAKPGKAEQPDFDDEDDDEDDDMTEKKGAPSKKGSGNDDET